MFKVMDHFDDCRDEEWESLKIGLRSDMGNLMPIEYREMFQYLLDNDKSECCEPGKTFILNFKHDDIVGHMKYVWSKYDNPMRTFMRLLAANARMGNDNYREIEAEDDLIYIMSLHFFFLPFEIFSPEFKKLRAKTELSMDEYGLFAVKCWSKALKNQDHHKDILNEIREYFYSCH